jgi:carbon monoxide dehydrogenase subunit G
MTTIQNQVTIDASPDTVRDAMRDIGALHTRLVPGFVTNTTVEAPDVRMVTFFNEMTVRETIISVDDAQRRIAWTPSGEGLPFAHYNGVAQVFAEGDRARVVWTTDFLPADQSDFVTAMIDKGLAAMKRAFEKPRA